jgi:hypothetical protein
MTRVRLGAKVASFYLTVTLNTTLPRDEEECGLLEFLVNEYSGQRLSVFPNQGLVNG